MAGYTYDYACGHGQGSTQLFGKHTERERKLQWMSQTLVCKDCYAEQRRKEDAEAKPVATLSLLAAREGEVRLLLVLSGQIGANKEDIKEKGFTWGELEGGLMDMLSMSAPSKAYSRVFQITSEEGLTKTLEEVASLVDGMGRTLRESLNPVDMLAASKALAVMREKEEARAAVAATDPQPAMSPLRSRIKGLETRTGKTWNGKVYGKKGGYNFYVDNVRHDATDEEVAEREENMKEFAAWKARHPELT